MLTKYRTPPSDYLLLVSLLLRYVTLVPPIRLFQIFFHHYLCHSFNRFVPQFSDFVPTIFPSEKPNFYRWCQGNVTPVPVFLPIGLFSIFSTRIIVLQIVPSSTQSFKIFTSIFPREM